MLLARVKMRIYDWLVHQQYFLEWLNSVKPRDNFMLVQIGANDGKKGDPVNSFIEKWKVKSLLVEPHPVVFQKLKANYSNQPKIIFDNVAVSDHEGTADLWCYQPPGSEEDWQTLFNTFEIGKGVSALQGDRENWKPVSVPTLTLDGLLKKHSISEVDLLVIDTEGHEFKIFSAFTFSIKPRAILYEHSNISYKETLAIRKRLIAGGYRIFIERTDTFALLR